MKEKIRVGLLLGGQSVEHEISILSARNVYEAMDRNKYEIFLIGIDKEGRWHFSDERIFLENGMKTRLKSLPDDGNFLVLVPGGERQSTFSLYHTRGNMPVDVIFPVLHGTHGEDGTVQGFLTLAGIPFVGAGILGSAIGMDKEVTKRLLRDAGIPTPHFRVFHPRDLPKMDFAALGEEMGLPFFVKPVSLGSSVGVHKVKTRDEFFPALQDAFQYDTKILAEQFIPGREIECSILGNDDPVASLPGEIIPRHDFYSYEAKYLDKEGAILDVPAQLSPALIRKIQETAVHAFQVLNCEGMARVDFFLRGEDLFVNELNTIPGFTAISMYPKLWEVSGIPYRELIDRLIQLALERFEREKKLKTSYEG
ncbi:MAG: D-alanine--D-alanine ligase [Candidatus Atribacteria bacterium]|nr:D-alanine--D-alanine ligase [Candidatus Atribacteria bacterium]